MKALNEEDDEFGLNLTPMIDVVFQLLIFFLLATTITEEERDLRVNLPGGTEGSVQGVAAGSRLVISVRNDGATTLGGVVMDWSELGRRLMEAGRVNDKPNVFLRGDEKAPYGKVAKVLQLCAKAKLSKVQVEYKHQALLGP